MRGEILLNNPFGGSVLFLSDNKVLIMPAAPAPPIKCPICDFTELIPIGCSVSYTFFSVSISAASPANVDVP